MDKTPTPHMFFDSHVMVIIITIISSSSSSSSRSFQNTPPRPRTEPASPETESCGRLELAPGKVGR